MNDLQRAINNQKQHETTYNEQEATYNDLKRPTTSKKQPTTTWSEQILTYPSIKQIINWRASIS